MKKGMILLCVVAVCLLIPSAVAADCKMTFEQSSPDQITGSCVLSTLIGRRHLTKTSFWNLYMSNGGPVNPDYSMINYTTSGTGECLDGFPCWPTFFLPTTIVPPLAGVAIFEQRVKSYSILVQTDPVVAYSCQTIDDHYWSQPLTCPPSESACNLSTAFISRCLRFGGDWDFLYCACSGCDTCGGSPILIDIDGDGFDLTNAADGVEFDLNGNGTRDHVSWTERRSDDSWLALDRNGNGTIDNGQELFGDRTPQAASIIKNGFLALSEFDSNQDGQITDVDPVFSNLTLWQDRNHNGHSEPRELRPLADVGIEAISLNFQASEHVDRYGNQYRYKARISRAHTSAVGQWAWDVYLVSDETFAETSRQAFKRNMLK